MSEQNDSKEKMAEWCNVADDFIELAKECDNIEIMGLAATAKQLKQKLGCVQAQKEHLLEKMAQLEMSEDE